MPERGLLPSRLTDPRPSRSAATLRSSTSRPAIPAQRQKTLPGYIQTGTTCGSVAIQLSPAAAPSCTITNSTQGTFVVHKDFSDKPSTDTTTVQVTLTCPGGGTITGGTTTPSSGPVSEASPRTFTDTGFSGTPNCTATEFPIPPGYIASGSPAGSCTGGLSTTALSTLTAVTGCTITNTLRDAIFNVTKVYSPTGPTANVQVTVTCPTSTSPNLAIDAAAGVNPAGSPHAFHVKGFNVGDQCTATETSVPAGYTASYSNCVDQTVADPSPAVNCTITNTLNTATFTVNKVYTNPSLTTPVTVHIGCSTGTPDDLVRPGRHQVLAAAPTS